MVDGANACHSFGNATRENGSIDFGAIQSLIQNIGKRIKIFLPVIWNNTADVLKSFNFKFYNLDMLKLYRQYITFVPLAVNDDACAINWAITQSKQGYDVIIISSDKFNNLLTDSNTHNDIRIFLKKTMVSITFVPKTIDSHYYTIQADPIDSSMMNMNFFREIFGDSLRVYSPNNNNRNLCLIGNQDNNANKNAKNYQRNRSRSCSPNRNRTKINLKRRSLTPEIKNSNRFISNYSNSRVISNTYRSPRRRSRSPRRRSRSPRRRSRSPRYSSRSPRYSSRSPRYSSRSPRCRSRSPKNYYRQPCVYFNNSYCKLGDKCKYSHEQGARFKKSLCINYERGCCPRRKEMCTFAHGINDIRR